MQVVVQVRLVGTAAIRQAILETRVCFREYIKCLCGTCILIAVCCKAVKLFFPLQGFPYSSLISENGALRNFYPFVRSLVR